MTHFEPILTQEDFDDAIRARIARERRNTIEARNDRDAFQRDARKWERFARENRAKIAVLEKTIDKFLDRFEDILEEEIDND